VFEKQCKNIAWGVYKIGAKSVSLSHRFIDLLNNIVNAYLADGVLGDNEMNAHQGHSIQYRIAVGQNTGKKVFALSTLPSLTEDTQGEILGKVAGFSLHAGVVAKAHERSKLERLCRYISKTYRNFKWGILTTTPGSSHRIFHFRLTFSTFLSF
jgi:hypothetical protein